VIVVDKVG